MFKKLFSAVVAAIPKEVKAVKNAAKKVAEKVAEVVEDVKEAVEELKDKVEEAVGKVLTAARRIADDIANCVQNLKQKMNNLIASGMSFLKNAGKYLGKGLKRLANRVGNGGWRELLSLAVAYCPILGDIKSIVSKDVTLDDIKSIKTKDVTYDILDFFGYGGVYNSIDNTISGFSTAGKMYWEGITRDGGLNEYCNDILNGDWDAVYNKITYWHFEGRDKLNGEYPTLEEIKNDPNWIELPKNMSVYHDNGIGKPERKFIHPDGREVVFDGDTGKVITDPQFKGTYNYINPKKPEHWTDWLDPTFRFEWAVTNGGHVVLDVLPYKLTGNKNERYQELNGMGDFNFKI